MVYKFPNSMSWWLTHAVLVTVTVLAAEYFCLKLETAEIKLSVGHILEKGKELGKEAAHKIIQKGEELKVKKAGKDVRKGKRKDKTEDV